jgi:hypothetical protein
VRDVGIAPRRLAGIVVARNRRQFLEVGGPLLRDRGGRADQQCGGGNGDGKAGCETGAQHGFGSSPGNFGPNSMTLSEFRPEV